MELTKTLRHQSLRYCAAAILSLLFSSAIANANNALAGDPYQKVEHITADLLNIIGSHQQGYPDNQQQYFSALSTLLDSAVDFKFIARSVMGSYSRAATPDQRALFMQKFRQGLVETYGRGLISYGNEKIVLVGRQPLKPDQKRLTVKQEIRSGDDVFPLQYSMARKKTGEWMIINVTLNGINLGKTFRSQFAQSAQRAAGDLDVVIDGWSSQAN